MGIIKAFGMAIGGALADQWLEIIEPDNMGEQTVFTRGIPMKNGQNKKGADGAVSNGSLIRVYDNQFMILTDGGKVIDYTAEPGYYKVDNSAIPSMFNGEFGDSLKEAFSRIKYGGTTSRSLKVYYINLQEIKGIKFGTRNPINYFDCFYNAELFLRAHGTYSIKIVNPLQFYAEAIPRNKDHVDIAEINEQYISEFLQALQASINQMSADGTRISHVTAKAMELGRYMASVLDQEWNQMRGMEIQSVGIASISYDEESKKLINMRNEGAMLSDPTIREGYMQGHIARGMEAAGSNSAGAMQGFMGMGMGMQMGGGMAGQMSQTNMAQMQMQQANAQMYGQQANAQMYGQQANAQMYGQPQGYGHPMGYAQPAGGAVPQQNSMGAAGAWTCACGHVNTGKFCSECGKTAPAKEWMCTCGQVNSGKFCSECGKGRP